MRYRYFIDFRHGISIFANFSHGIGIGYGPSVPVINIIKIWCCVVVFQSSWSFTMITFAFREGKTTQIIKELNKVHKPSYILATPQHTLYISRWEFHKVLYTYPGRYMDTCKMIQHKMDFLVLSSTKADSKTHCNLRNQGSLIAWNIILYEIHGAQCMSFLDKLHVRFPRHQRAKVR